MTDTDYKTFLKSKIISISRRGVDVSLSEIHPMLFDWQKLLTQWALRKGTAALFADTGLGKTFMQLEWARLTGQKSLIIAPLSVARQTVREAAKIDVSAKYVRNESEVDDGQVFVTNYERIDGLDFSAFGAVVLDESSILKSLDGKTRQRLTELCEPIPFKLCCTATPAPNDISEIANHAEFLGVMTRAEMLAMFFVHDDDGYRLKGHAQEAFFRWLASWGMSVRKPSDLGFADDGYNLPPLVIEPVFVQSDYRPEGQLFFTGLDGLSGRLDARRNTLEERCQKAAELVAAEPDRQWIVWCGLNDEQDLMARLLPESVSVYGSQSPDEKAELLESFQDGESRILITKPKIAAFGMNFQNATRQVFVGLSDSYETYYQAVRRSWRFGQDQEVRAYIVLSEAEDEVYQNVLRKEREASEMSQKLIENVQQFERAEIGAGTAGDWSYQTNTCNGENWSMLLGDSCERLKELEAESIDFSVYSPPFMSLYTYSPSERDLGNSKSEDEFFGHYAFILEEIYRLTRPGRLTAVHVAQVPAMLVRDGYIGLKDFRGRVIDAHKAAGWIHHGEVVIDKDPQAQAIRTKSKALLFTQMHKDSSWSRPALADFILVFRKPGENRAPVKPDLTNNEWIEWARPIWYGIKETDTLQYTTAREEQDERHICPLQLGTIERCVRLWSNPGELVLSPFAGIGSEGYQAIRLGRRFVGIELKEAYWRVACRNLAEAEANRNSITLFDFLNLQAGE